MLRAVLRFAGWTRTGQAILLGGGCDTIGVGLFIAISIPYFTAQLGLSATQVGVGLSIAGASGSLALLPTGILGDRYSPRNLLLVLYALKALGFLAYTVITGFVGFLAATCMVILAERSAVPLLQTFVAKTFDPDLRTTMLARLRTVQNVGYSIGSLIATLPLAVNTRPSYELTLGLVAAAPLTAGLVLLWASREGISRAFPTPRVPRDDKPFTDMLRNRAFIALAVSTCVFLLGDSVLSVGLPLWLKGHTPVSLALIGPLFALNTALVVFLQIPISGLIRSTRSATIAMVGAGVLLAISTFAFVVAGSLPATPATVALAAGVALLTGGEMLNAAAGWHLSFELASPHALSRYLSLFSLASSVQKTLGPLLVIAIVSHGSTQGWLGLAVVFLLTSLLFTTRPLRPVK